VGYFYGIKVIPEIYWAVRGVEVSFFFSINPFDIAYHISKFGDDCMEERLGFIVLKIGNNEKMKETVWNKTME
jgi:hypothetical protein